MAGLAAALLVLGGVLTVLPQVDSAQAVAAPAPTRNIAVSGPGVTGIGPAFDPAVSRYSVHTAAGQNGRLTVTATTSDPQGVVRVDGVAVRGATTLTGLVEGDEVSVIISDSSGTRGYALVYLPPDFPDLTATVDAGGAAPGQVLLTLTDFAGSRTFEVAVDHNGVPSYFHVSDRDAMDLKPAPNGHFTVFRSTQADRKRFELDELDGRFRPVRTMTVADPLTNTDVHDAILRQDGSHVLIGYEPNPVTHRTDATIQEIDTHGDVVYTWSSADHFLPDESTANPGNPDYAHLNSIQELPDGDLLASFRHTSSVMRIAWHDHDGFHRGDIVWRLGGRHSDFTFPDDPDGGPCAQHTASMLADGNILVFDNGSGWPDSNALCVNPADRTGPTMSRPHTRIAEYALSFDAGGAPATATLAWTYDGPAQGFTLFTGSARRLPGGNTLIGWGALRHTIASEVTPDKQVVWELTTSTQMVSYRAVKADVPDLTPPVVNVGLADGVTVDAGTRIPAARCTDKGGSNLVRCTTTSDASLVSATTGRHTLRVEAVDGAGNTTVVTRTFVVRSGHPVLQVRRGGTWRHAGVVVLPARGARRTVPLRVTNDRAAADLVRLHASGPGSAYRVRFLQGGRDVTRSVLAGTWATRLGSGGSTEVTMVVRRVRTHAPGRRVVVLQASSAAQPGRADAVTVTLRRR
ncbi:hypothetical protein GCM10009798_20650 [Nocardioides panacihumi]|uniref:Arylsulfotransferase N-terminal domain-containing protein n=1 Tax=Nocardioides panacihumi TaxID=400774 RepID=A0ABN2QZC4_9ACTN